MRLEEFRSGSDGHVSDGVLICRTCETWYPIDRDVLEFVPPPLFYRDQLSAFCAHYADRFSALGLAQPPGEDTSQYAGQIRQREHFDSYAEDKPEFPDYTLIPFIKATSARYIKLAGSTWTEPDTMLLDIGCGTGIHSWPLMKRCILTGFDISKAAVRNATEGARSRGLLKNGTFFVGDGSFLPFVDNCFDRTITFGVLHHLPNPQEVVTDIQRVLKPGGIHFAVENNKSAFRKTFDLLMLVWPLWVEEAGSQPLISRQMVEDWTRGLSVVIDSETSVFVPPQLVNLFGTLAVPVIEYSDRLFSMIPLWNRHGGQLVFKIRKTAFGSNNSQSAARLLKGAPAV
jgi:SAM-dependent methyltransferase